jgi:hypothetical protein
MAASVTWWRVVLAFVAALVVGSVLGSLIQTQFNLHALEALGVQIGIAIRLETSVQDLVNFAPLYTILFGVSFLFSQSVAALVVRLAGNVGRLWLFPIAAAAGLWVTLVIVNALAPMPTLIAATRGAEGLMAMRNRSGYCLVSLTSASVMYAPGRMVRYICLPTARMVIF